MTKNRYVKFRLPKEKIRGIAEQKGKERINFHIDLQSICTGLYAKDNLFFEINYYLQNREPGNFLVTEFREYLNDLFRTFKNFNPFMVTFYDYGKNTQNTAISSGYKSGSSGISEVLQDKEERQLFFELKYHYFQEIEKTCSIKNHGKVYFLKDYESDFIPYFCLLNNIHNSNENNVLNVILSNDKDLLQCCKYRNTIQCTNIFTVGKDNRKHLNIELWDDYNAINYICRNFKPGLLFSRHIPLILAIAGDASDSISGIKGLGPKRAIDLIQTYDIQPDVYYLRDNKEKLPQILRDNIDQVIENFMLISFDEQIKRSTEVLERHLD